MTTDKLQNTLQLEVSSFRSEAKDAVVLDLRDRYGKLLPPFTPGAHLEIYLANGLVRHYSICNSSVERDRYCIGVSFAKDSRGGSQLIHQLLRRGDTLTASTPRNNFPLVADAAEYCFVAGGIGITPILSMIRWCIQHAKPWRLYYCARSRQRAAFYEDIQAFGVPENVRFHIDEEQAGRLFDPGKALETLSAAAHIYCCGPAPLMNAVQSAARNRPDDHVHFEWFSPKAPIMEVARRPFTVVIRSTGQRLEIAPDKSILSTLEEHGISIPYSCREGVCATCQTTVVAGIPDHLDSVLSAEQHASNQTMLICVSRAQSDVLELDI